MSGREITAKNNESRRGQRQHDCGAVGGLGGLKICEVRGTPQPHHAQTSMSISFNKSTHQSYLVFTGSRGKGFDSQCFDCPDRLSNFLYSPKIHWAVCSHGCFQYTLHNYNHSHWSLLHPLSTEGSGLTSGPFPLWTLPLSPTLYCLSIPYKNNCFVTRRCNVITTHQALQNPDNTLFSFIIHVTFPFSDIFASTLLL